LLHVVSVAERVRQQGLQVLLFERALPRRESFAIGRGRNRALASKQLSNTRHDSPPEKSDPKIEDDRGVRWFGLRSNPGQRLGSKRKNWPKIQDDRGFADSNGFSTK